MVLPIPRRKHYSSEGTKPTKKNQTRKWAYTTTQYRYIKGNNCYVFGPIRVGSTRKLLQTLDISRSYMIRKCTQHSNYNDKTSITFALTNETPTPPLRARRATGVFGELWPRYIESALYSEYIVFNSLDMHDLVMFSKTYELCTQLLFCVYYGRVIIAPSYIFIYIYICRIGTGLSWLCHVCHMRMRDLAKGNSKCVGRVNRHASSLIRVRQNDIHIRPVLILFITHHPEFW